MGGGVEVFAIEELGETPRTLRVQTTSPTRSVAPFSPFQHHRLTLSPLLQPLFF